MGKKRFVLYDGRAVGGNTDDALVMDMAETEKEARKAGSTTWHGQDGIWYEYDERGDELVGGTPRFNLPPREV
ncbi:MAG: hypothetical protein NNA31_04755 [Nitrospira sp.]|nr:hypothetical protein [Nitrospira sp.]